jgi:hypothetical protein
MNTQNPKASSIMVWLFQSATIEVPSAGKLIPEYDGGGNELKIS